jgi:alpha-galactosidase
LSSNRLPGNGNFQCFIEKVCGVADVIAANGLKDLGYEYVVVDDCWSVKRQRDNHGDLAPDPQRFPDGMKPVADYVHSKGLKFGIYSDAAELDELFQRRLDWLGHRSWPGAGFEPA